MITVGFSKPKNRSWPFGYVLSWLIRLIERTPYSHCFVRWKSDYLEREIIYEASGMSVGFKEGSHFDQKSETVFKYNIPCSPEVRKKIIQKAMDFSGNPYGIKQLFGILWVKFVRAAFRRDCKNPFSDGKATWVCSEIVSEILEVPGFKLSVSRDNVTPKDVQSYLELLVKDGVINRE